MAMAALALLLPFAAADANDDVFMTQGLFVP